MECRARHRPVLQRDFWLNLFNNFFQLRRFIGGELSESVLQISRQIFRCGGQFTHRDHQLILDAQQILAYEIIFRRGTR